MVLNRFKLLVFAQIILIALVGMLITISLQREFMLMTSAGLIVLWMGQILFLNIYMNRIHRDVKRFMDAMRSQDTSQFFNEQKAGRYFEKLYASFNEITRNFRLVRIEKEVENQFYRETIRQSASGIVTVTADDKIHLVNQAALHVLGMESLVHLKELRKVHSDLAELFSTGEIGDHQVKILVNGRMIQLAVKCTEMHLNDASLRIFTLLDISRQLALSEVEAWQKLIRVLNHEITNSVVPLHILSSSLLDQLHEGELRISSDKIDDDVIDRMVLGLRTIEKRSSGLRDFVQAYQNFTEIGEAVYSSFSVPDVFRQVTTLLADDLNRSGIKVNTEVSPLDLQLLADEKLVVQTLINLIKNSMSALEKREHPVIHLKASVINEQVSIEVNDNGRGIPDEIRDSIFTPFFTTRKGGSGIGLSLARQVMLMHNGSIHVSSEEGRYTSFMLTF